ncbi:TPA: hypothetical protein LUC54_003305 [Acinetobacter baumannii]|uniref:Uncharacterized protein n=2 Tax=Acinetobacter baumannii (strain ATCC 19606 / DSM 30007 / JCM 6841 / CCUG 19606 / CIP 70.34 / NBRC 109757 / NCIMB 12457 / NCTC 12156 / 81) TaxID=575584 RepID=D0CFQ4_ACIB2|nr:hypothetical protein [Acinetobacter baumannii]ARN31388.1 hypothetical protein A4U85_11770 [Acinetobacter baumannii]EEX01805.1 hypothetical protein HMPREF0010_03584 [Acinetobacter baumannii ATCC 19606 = CIP 70.34 = JCM 6841]EHU1845159.1 hypothetical protein [Acinetobacter baumannii]EKU5224350.1 hypothetical protein [Acinetobacter baumannii]EKU6961612.1 hypothetical protein [Acinetobacter baumannii]
MKERPIIFNTNMVKAILEGRKTQTRRPVKPQPLGHSLDSILDGKWLTKSFDGLLSPKIKDLPMHCPFGQIGDRLWVRETWYQKGTIGRTYPDAEDEFKFFPEKQAAYYADGLFAPWTSIKRPSIHMPRWASRILLEITDIRVERLNELSEADAKAEGLDNSRSEAAIQIGWYELPVPAFRRVWEWVYGQGSWKQNPWVWVIEFKVIQGGES